MKTKELERMKKFYEEKMEFKKRIQKAKDEVEELKKDPAVIKYLKLSKFLSEEETIIWGNMFDSMVREHALINANPTVTNRLYLKFGVFENNIDLRREAYDNLVFLSDDDPKAGYAYYLSLEEPLGNTSSDAVVPASEIDKFEEDNVVLVNKDFPKKNSFLYYYELRSIFINKLIKEDEDAAVKAILDIYRNQ